MKEKIINPNNTLKEDIKTKKVILDTKGDLFDMSKPVPNKLVIGTFGSIFILSVLIAGGIHIYAKKKGYIKK